MPISFRLFTKTDWNCWSGAEGLAMIADVGPHPTGGWAAALVRDDIGLSVELYEPAEVGGDMVAFYSLPRDEEGDCEPRWHADFGERLEAALSHGDLEQVELALRALGLQRSD